MNDIINEVQIPIQFHCSRFTLWNNGFKDDCPYKNDGMKPCINKGKLCKNLCMELIDITQ